MLLPAMLQWLWMYTSLRTHASILQDEFPLKSDGWVAGYKCFKFWLDGTKFFFEICVSNYTSSKNIWRCSFYYALTDTYCYLIHFYQSTRWKMISSLICIALIIRQVRHISCSLVISSFIYFLFISFNNFPTGLFFCRSFQLFIYGYEPLSFILGVNNLCHLFFLSFIMVSSPQFHNFHVVEYNNLFLYDFYFGIILRRVLLNPKSWNTVS